MKNLKNVKNINGITLIALIITIVILIILASVAINMSLSNKGIFEKTKQAREDYLTSQNDEQIGVSKLVNDINTTVNSNRGTVTLTEEEYAEFKRKGKTLLWQGVGNTEGKEYLFIDENMDIMDYDFVSIEFIDNQLEGILKSSTIISTSSLTLNKNYDVAIYGYGTRYTSMYFKNNSFTINIIGAESSTNYYICPIKIYGINM